MISFDMVSLLGGGLDRICREREGDQIFGYTKSNITFLIDCDDMLGKRRPSSSSI